MVVKEPDVAHLDLYAQLAYLFNPYIVTSCAAKSTTVLANLILALFILSMLKKSRFFGTLFLALATYQSLYAVMLIVPLVVILTEDDKSSPTWRHAALKKVLPIVAPFVLALGGLLYGSYALLGYNASFLGATYGFILSVPELTPNMGLFWYFFTEMFEHYRIFFVCTFQINVFIYVIPLTIRLRKDPFLLAFTLIGKTGRRNLAIWKLLRRYSVFFHKIIFFHICFRFIFSITII